MVVVQGGRGPHRASQGSCDCRLYEALINGFLPSQAAGSLGAPGRRGWCWALFRLQTAIMLIKELCALITELKNEGSARLLPTIGIILGVKGNPS